MERVTFSPQFKTALSVGLVLCLLLTLGSCPVLAKEKQISLKWNELANRVPGKKATVALTDGEILDGKVLTLSADSLTMNAGKTSSPQKYPKGMLTIARSSVSVVRLRETKGMFRALGTASGALGGYLISIFPLSYYHNEGGSEAVITGIVAGLVGGGAAIGYAIGREMDHHVTVISVVP